MPNPKCDTCGKTVYPLEAISDQGKTWHKFCFKCQGVEGDAACGLKLTLKTYTGVGGKIFCPKHTPKDKPTSVTVDGSLSLSNAKNAPKVDTYNKEKRGDNMERPAQVTVEDSLHMSHAKKSHEQARTLVSNEQRAKGMERNAQVLDYAHTSAKAAPKVATVNDQVRGPDAGARNAQVADYKMSAAMNAPKVDTVNQQVRRTEHTNAQVLDMAHESARNAPKNATVNDQIRATEHKNAQVLDMAHENARNAPKSDTVNEQVRKTEHSSSYQPAF